VAAERLSTGVPGLNERLGGGLLRGTLTVVVGATGIGKTQLGVQFAQAGAAQEGPRGVFFDLSARGDSQSHADYARRMFAWNLQPAAQRLAELAQFFDAPGPPGDYLHVFDYSGQRVTKRDLDFAAWHDWQAQLNERLEATIAFFYGNFVRGVRRVVIDGIEPVDKPGDSIQFEMFEYIYHQILRKEPAWVARDLFRQHYRQYAEQIAQHPYDPAQLGCLLLATSHELLLDDLLNRRLDEGDVLANANTLILMGKVRQANGFGRALYVAKHRGSACADEIIPFRIDDRGLHVG
jgi:hypothetical protein